MQHLSEVLWAPIQTSHIQGMTSNKEQLRRRNSLCLGFVYHQAQAPLLMKASKVFKSSLRKEVFGAVVLNCLRLWRSSQCFSDYSQNTASTDIGNRGFATLLRAAQNKFPPSMISKLLSLWQTLFWMQLCDRRPRAPPSCWKQPDSGRQPEQRHALTLRGEWVSAIVSL